MLAQRKGEKKMEMEFCGRLRTFAEIYGDLYHYAEFYTIFYRFADVYTILYHFIPFRQSKENKKSRTMAAFF